MTHRIVVAATQMACSWDRSDNLDRAERLIRTAAGRGANVVLLQELFETPYFCIEQSPKHFDLATTSSGNPAIARMTSLARELGVVIPVSWFERSGQNFFNSLAMIDANGTILGVYRKSHIPNDVAYQEKQYFTPGDTGFRVWQTQHGCIGVGVCWDQWFPEAARCMVIGGAELLLYPTAIGFSRVAPGGDSMQPWQTVMRGHAAANAVPVVASNRIGAETATVDKSTSINFYGSSFISDHRGEIVAQADRATEDVIVASLDLDEARDYRTRWGLFRDRRPDLYISLVGY